MRQALADSALAREDVMLDRLCAAAKEFYENPLNQQAFLAWKKNKEAQYEDHDYHGPDPGKPG